MTSRNRVGWALPTIGGRQAQLVGGAHPTAFTLVEMLVAMAITLVMMGAVVTLFANISNSVRNRRATIEMSSQLRHVRNVLQQDLQGATCPGVTWQRPESNHGYIEIIEGQYREGYATNLIDANPSVTTPQTWPPSKTNPEIDHKLSTIPSSNLAFNDPTWATDAAGLGDADDVVMLTSRNEREPFVGRAPTGVRLNATDAEQFDVNESSQAWGYESITSPLAEVVWFAIENPGYTEDPPVNDPTANRFFGEPGMRTIYRRTLLIAPWLNPYRYTNPSTGAVVDTFKYLGDDFKAQPGLMRMLPKNIALDQAIAAVVAFQDRYDLSVRLEWDADIQRWKIMANTLADLTKRENRFGHFGFEWGPSSTIPPRRSFPFAAASMGCTYSGSQQPVAFMTDPEVTAGAPAQAQANLANAGNLSGVVVSYWVDPSSYTAGDPTRRYPVRPFTYVRDRPTTVTPPEIFVPATAQAILNNDGQVVRVVHGPVPLWGARRGEDVMMTNVLAFDLRVYDPGAPMFATRKLPYDSTKGLELDVVLTPTDPGWLNAYMHSDNMGATGGIGHNNSPANITFPFVGQGAYVDMGYGYNTRYNPPGLPAPQYFTDFSTSAAPWFFTPRGLSDVFGHLLSPGFAVYDTWSFHYENDGVDEDGSGTVDQGTNGLDDRDFRTAAPIDAFNIPGDFAVLGVDDANERETTPPYDKPLRGMQALIRSYENDSRSIRQVRVNQHFMQE
jgi:type II secretory pathway pseudopilin PulG